jgi:nitroreductase
VLYRLRVAETTAPDILRPLRRTRQVREFTAEPVSREALDAIADVARWTGSSRNSQPWRFIVVTDPTTIQELGVAGMPQTRSLGTATAVLAIVLNTDSDHDAGQAYDDGRAAERVLIAAGMLGLGAGIAWVRDDVRPVVGRLLDLPPDRYVRTIMAIGHPTEAALAPKVGPGKARLPRSETVFEERWPDG